MKTLSLFAKTEGAIEKLLTSALNSLPFNGEKLKLALWVAVLAGLQIITGLDFGIGIPPDITLPASLGAALLFLLHRILKKRAGLDRWGDAIK